MPEASNSTAKLTDAIEQLSDDINGLMQVAEEGTLLTQLIAELQTLRSAIDDARAEIEWAARNLMQTSPPRPLPEPITSFPVDPCDPEFAEKVNAVSRANLPPSNGGVITTAESTTPATVPSDESVLEAPLYCCENPILLWVGDPEGPGIYCKSCNFIVAEYGQIIDQRDERPNGFRGVPKEKQKLLWSDGNLSPDE